MNLPAVVAMVGLGLLVVNEVFAAWNFTVYKQENNDFKGAVKRKSRYKNIVLCVAFLSAAASVYSSIADKAESDAEVAELRTHMQRTDDRVERLAAAASRSAEGASVGDADPRLAQVQERIRVIEKRGLASGAEVQELRSDVEELSARLEVIETVLKRFEK